MADGVMAVTHKLVQQAMTGQWQDVPRTIEERRAMLDRLTTSATPQDQPWLTALKQAIAESDAAVEKMTLGLGAQAPAFGIRDPGFGIQDSTQLQSLNTNCPADRVASTLDMIRQSR